MAFNGQGPVKIERFTGAAALSETITCTVPMWVLGIRIKLDSECTASEYLTITRDSGTSPVYDHEYKFGMENVESFDKWLANNFNQGLVFDEGDEVGLAWPNSQSKTYGLEVFWQQIGFPDMSSQSIQSHKERYNILVAVRQELDAGIKAARATMRLHEELMDGGSTRNPATDHALLQQKIDALIDATSGDGLIDTVISQLENITPSLQKIAKVGYPKECDRMVVKEGGEVISAIGAAGAVEAFDFVVSDVVRFSRSEHNNNCDRVIASGSSTSVLSVTDALPSEAEEVTENKLMIALIKSH